jgi:glycosyltransferase involved in cell wall biosynthesis
MTVERALATVRDAPFIVDVLRAADDLALAAARNGGRRAAHTLTRAIHDPEDQLTAIAAVHALGRVFDDEADAVLSDLLSHPHGFLREHASWTLGARLPRLDAIGRLVAVVATGGGFAGMLAQRTLIGWARSASDHGALALEGAIAAELDRPARARLVETLGLVPGALAGRAVIRIAADPREQPTARLAAVAALGERGSDPAAIELVRRLAGRDPFSAAGQWLEDDGTGDPQLRALARLAALDLGLIRPGPSSAPPAGPTVAQLFLHADIDRELTRSGVGDNGGVATLLLRLGDALAAEPQIGRVLTLSRGSATASVAALTDPADGGVEHLLSPVPLLQIPSSASAAWPTRVAAERAIRRAVLRHGRVDVLHLRMADVGSLAADAVARDLGIPVVFTLAPDPHAVIHSLDMTGALSRAGFGAVDEQEHYWFRARLVQRLAANAAHNVLFPRPDLEHTLRDLLGIDITAEPHRYTVVPEGIDLAVSAAAHTDLVTAVTAVTAIGGGPAPALTDLTQQIAGLPVHRHGLPLAISVGRLHRVKGMATVVEAWATDPALRERCNLVIVGGDLADPSPEEQGQLELIQALLAEHPAAAEGLVLAGHRPNDDVARWLAAARLGLSPLVGADGIYVCGSLKEEFGLAILEAMAAGLVVVAPDGGGPATYVEPGVTGLLVNTREPAAVAGGMAAALHLAAHADREQRVEKVTTLIRDRFTVQAMASALAGVYAGVTEPSRR